MPFDPLVANPGRLEILTALAGEAPQEFVRLRERTRLTDGNLASHAKRLQTGGLIAVDKWFRAGKPVTSFALTPTGRAALESHVRSLMGVLTSGAGFIQPIPPPPVVPDVEDEDPWID